MKNLGSFFLLLCASSAFGGKRLCYYTNWSQYRGSNGHYTAKDIDASLCDVVIYCFATMDGNKMEMIEWNDKDMFKILEGHKATHPHLKTIISVGGATFDIRKMSSMLSLETSRKQFIESTIAFMMEHKFDGVEFAFEHPGSNGSPETDKARFATFLKEFRATIQGYDFLITIGAPAAKVFVEKGYDIALISKSVDWFSLRSFDYNGHWQMFVGIGAPLFPRDDQSGDALEFNVKWTLDYYEKAGAKREQLMVGFPAYARGWTLYDPKKTDVGAFGSGPSNAGVVINTEGILAYSEICDCKNVYPDFTRKYHDEHKSPYAIFYTDQWISYDDQANIKMKVDWIKEEGYGGFMFWTLDNDDFKHGFCSNGTYPLLRAASDAMKA